MIPNSPSFISRRDFLTRSALAAAGTLACAQSAPLALAQQKDPLPIVVFSKVYQTLNLSYEDAAAITAEAGLDGVDVPLRPKGEVEPERVKEDLPRYIEALKKRNLSMPLIATAITGISSPHAEAVLRMARRSGTRYYRVGFVDREADVTRQIREIKAAFKELAALNKQVGITALVQNHSPSSGRQYLGGDMTELRKLVEDFDPKEIAIAFDIGHALIVHKDGWREHFAPLKSHLRIAYLKDASKSGRWVPFGQGDAANSGYFKLLREMHYQAPVSLHLEYDWHQNGKEKNRATLLKALKEGSAVLRQWLAEA